MSSSAERHATMQDGKTVPLKCFAPSTSSWWPILDFCLSTLLISVDEFDLVTNFTAVAATFNNIGPGLAMVGPTQNFSVYSPFSQLVLIFDMLAGRLELFPMLVLFSKDTWKRVLTKALVPNTAQGFCYCQGKEQPVSLQ